MDIGKVNSRASSLYSSRFLSFSRRTYRTSEQASGREKERAWGKQKYGERFFFSHPLPLLLTFRARSQFCSLCALLKISCKMLPFFERYYKSDSRYWHFLLASTSLKVTTTTTTTTTRATILYPTFVSCNFLNRATSIKKINSYFTYESRDAIKSFTLFITVNTITKLNQGQNDNFKISIYKFAVVVHVLQTMQNLIISRC